MYSDDGWLWCELELGTSVAGAPCPTARALLGCQGLPSSLCVHFLTTPEAAADLPPPPPPPALHPPCSRNSPSVLFFLTVGHDSELLKKALKAKGLFWLCSLKWQKAFCSVSLLPSDCKLCICYQKYHSIYLAPWPYTQLKDLCNQLCHASKL